LLKLKESKPIKITIFGNFHGMKFSLIKKRCKIKKKIFSYDMLQKNYIKLCNLYRIGNKLVYLHLKKSCKDENKVKLCTTATLALGPKIVAVVDRWPLCRGHLSYKSSKWNLNKVVSIRRWS